MKRMVFAVLLAVTMLLPCFSFADGQELILENFEDAGVPAEELFKPEDLSSWGIMPPDSMTYSEQGAQSGNGLLVVFGESGGTQTYCIEQDWISGELAPGLENYKYFRLWVDNKTQGDLRVTIVLAENLDPDPAIRRAGYLPVSGVYGVWEEDGYVDEFQTGPSLCDPDNNPDASIYIPSEFRGYVYWELPESAEELISQTEWGVGAVSSFDKVAAMQIDVRGEYGTDGNSYLFDSISLSNGWEQEAESSPAATGESGGLTASETAAGSAGTNDIGQNPNNAGIYIAAGAAAVVIAAVVVTVIVVRKRKSPKE